MASQTQGIQQLLQAEKRAADKVNEARKRKARRLKQAKEEAQQEIDKYKQERERQFADYEAKHLGSKDDIALNIQSDTVNQLKGMEVSVKQNKEQVIQKLLAVTYDVKPEVHRNLKFQVTT